MAISGAGKDLKVIWLNTEKRPWRDLTALIGFASSENMSKFTCLQLKECLPRGARAGLDLGVFSGGLKVRVGSGDQSVKQSDDFVESTAVFPASVLDSKEYSLLMNQVSDLEKVGKALYVAVRNYYEYLGAKKTSYPEKASVLFWSLCERDFSKLLYSLDSDGLINEIRKSIARHARQSFDLNCGKNTARQINSWAKNKPNLSFYTITKQG